MKVPMHYSIAKPCQANWDEMTKNEQGRYCALCKKTVVDFTEMTDQQVCAFLIRNADQGTCGRFFDFQLDNKYSPMQKRIIRMYHHAEEHIKNRLCRVAALFAISLAMTITGCQQKNPTQGELAPTASVDSLNSDTSTALLGDTIAMPSSDTNTPRLKHVEPQKIENIKGEILIDDEKLRELKLNHSRKKHKE